MACRGGKGIDPRLIDPRNRVAFPRAVLRSLGAAAGDFVGFTIDPDGVVRVEKLAIAPAPRPPQQPRT